MIAFTRGGSTINAFLEALEIQKLQQQLEAANKKAADEAAKRRLTEEELHEKEEQLKHKAKACAMLAEKVVAERAAEKVRAERAAEKVRAERAAEKTLDLAKLQKQDLWHPMSRYGVVLLPASRYSN